MQRFALVAISVLVAAIGPARTEEYRVVEVPGGGTIAGHVTFAGTPPPAKKLTVAADVDVCGRDEKFSRDLIVAVSGGLKNAVAHLKNVKQGKAWPTNDHILRQTNCRFEPHIFLVSKGADVHLVNTDRIAHTVRSWGSETVFNIGQPRFVVQLLVEDFTKRLSGQERARIGCDFHKWMSAHVIVQDSPYYAVSDDEGVFTLTDIIPGNYELVLWHEKLGTTSRKLTVAGDTRTSVSFELSDGG